MLDFQASPTLPLFAFGKYDEVIMDGISYRAVDRDDSGFVFVRTDSTGVAESFTHQELSRRVTLGKLEHRRDAFLPETAKRRLKIPSRVRWYSEDLGAIAVELNGEWIEVPSVFERFQGQRAQTWIMAVREIQASVAAQKKVDEEVIFNAMNRIREINSNAMARIGLMVEDYSKERIDSLENGMLIGFNVDETPLDAMRLPSTGIGLELPTAQHKTARDTSDVNMTGDTTPAPSEENDVSWTMDEK